VLFLFQVVDPLFSTRKMCLDPTLFPNRNNFFEFGFFNFIIIIFIGIELCFELSIVKVYLRVNSKCN
jgi:hypothetical protein